MEVSIFYNVLNSYSEFLFYFIDALQAEIGYNHMVKEQQNHESVLKVYNTGDH